MAILDQDQNCVVLRIVYSGAPMSGKTENLRSLSELILGKEKAPKELYTPEAANGRTLYFDWLNYVGGYYKGYKLNCQLISVPGQKTLTNRRKMLLEMADAIVFVVDSDTNKMASSCEYYNEMEPWLKRQDEPPVGIIVQANKRDLSNAAPLDVIRETFNDDPNLLILESIATQSYGIRETFVSAVRVGLERAAWLIDNDKITIGTSDLENGTDLLAKIKEKELIERRELSNHQQRQETNQDFPENNPPEIDLSSSQLLEIIEKKVSGHTEEALSDQENKQADHPIKIDSDRDSGLNPKPALPNKQVVAGGVYPPVSGRIILHQLKQDDHLIMMQSNMGDWEAQLSKQWKLINRDSNCFKTCNDARFYLTEFAKLHKQLKDVISEHRCLAIAEEPNLERPWRIWEVVRIETSLKNMLDKALTSPVPHIVAERIYIIAEKFIQAHELITNIAPHLPINLENLGLNNSVMGLTKSRMSYIDFIPDLTEKSKPLSALEALAENFKPPIHSVLNGTLAMSVPYIIHNLDIYAKNNSEKMIMVDTLKTLLIGET